jgi:hypothetical protein
MLIKVKVFPSSKKNKIVGKSADSFEVYVKEKPERGLATKAVFGLLTRHFKLTLGSIKLIKGARSRNKIFNIE